MQVMHIGHVTLRRLEAKDIPELARLADNRKIWDNVRDYFPHPYTEDNARLFIFSKADENPQQTFAIDLEGALVGVAGLVPQHDIYRYAAEVGYWLGENYWGRGIATEVLRLLVRYAFDDLLLERLFAGVFAYNKPSMRVLEKVGFQLECISRKAAFKNGQFVDEYRYVLLKQDQISPS